MDAEAFIRTGVNFWREFPPWIVIGIESMKVGGCGGMLRSHAIHSPGRTGMNLSCRRVWLNIHEKSALVYPNLHGDSLWDCAAACYRLGPAL